MQHDINFPQLSEYWWAQSRAIEAGWRLIAWCPSPSVKARCWLWLRMKQVAAMDFPGPLKSEFAHLLIILFIHQALEVLGSIQNWFLKHCQERKVFLYLLSQSIPNTYYATDTMSMWGGMIPPLEETMGKKWIHEVGQGRSGQRAQWGHR